MIKSMRTSWAGNLALIGKKKSAYIALTGKHERKGPLGKPKRRCEDIKIYVRIIRCGVG
jgi:hypothetical protein